MQTLAIFLGLTGLLGGPTTQDWTHYLRIAGHGLRLDNAEEIVRESTGTNVFGIEVDNYGLYRVVDTIAHEYATGGRAAARTPPAWFQDMIGMYSFRSFAGSKPSWMLSYSWGKEKQISTEQAMKNLAMAAGHRGGRCRMVGIGPTRCRWAG